MLYLDHTTKFPEHSEWSYLYAVAEVYKNYSIDRSRFDLTD